MAAEAEIPDDITVLVVDDSEFFADMLVRELHDRAALDAESYYTPEAAIGAIRERDDIDCIVSDYRMPEIDGLGLLDAVREDDEELPFIILTGQGSENVASQAIKQGATDYITKETILEDSEFGLLLNRIQKGVDHYRTEKQLQRNREQLEERNDQLTVLNKMLRHDVRNDLQLVLGYLEQLDKHVDGPEREHLETAKESAENAVDVTDTAGNLLSTVIASEDNAESVAVHPTIRRQVEEIDAAHSKASVDVAGTIPSTHVRGSELLGTVVRNLITNGIEHNDRSEPRVLVSVSVDDDDVRISVADDGPGVPDGLKDRILDEGETGPASDGMGIGLYLVATFLERYGGSISIENRTQPFPEEAIDETFSEGETDKANTPSGSVFTVELPIAE